MHARAWRGVHLRDDGPILIVGAGAIGTLLAARLAEAGTAVVVAARDAAGARLLEGGLRAVAPDGAVVEAKVPVVHGVAAPEAPPRMLVLATKCADAEPALRQWLPHLPDEAPVVTLQNGVLGDRLKALAGDRLVECTVSFPATLDGPGQATQTGPGHLHLGPWPKASPRDDPQSFRNVGQALAPATPVLGNGNMQGVKWSKLAINSCITSLGVLTGVELGNLLADRRARRAFLAIVEEAYAAGHAEGVKFEAVSGFRPALFGNPVPGRDLLLRLLGRKYRRHRSSSLQSLDRGRRTEVDFLNGHIVATARRHGLAAPVNAAVVDLVHEIEAGQRKPSLANLDTLMRTTPEGAGRPGTK